MLTDPALAHVVFDISWDEVAKYAVSSPDTSARVAAMLNRFRIGSCSAPTPWRPRARRPITGSSTCGRQFGNN